ncbi:hypothetical protein K503DRAFT_477055 [Rhizopogon vinicolor AM-OR11-026]|uniref:Uncharacterized protein n=1 Tax=Rhizopogon vinicolor AM-OR11-026 TaxID=1314800 RepID=A0A1B7MN24_9AGAM|nr:hypothetical protein K503DRAFT_477055 [Rhizopogon vinicolor AM-OR11-026]
MGWDVMPDSKKLVVNSWSGDSLEVWDIQAQKLDRRMKGEVSGPPSHAPVFWTKKGTILVAFSFNGSADTIYEFDASALETVGAPFKGHTDTIEGLALSSDDALVASTSSDSTIKLWAFDSRQLLASFRGFRPNVVVFSPDTQQLAYTTFSDSQEIFVCNTPPNILASIGLATKGHPTETAATLEDLLGVCVMCIFTSMLVDFRHCSRTLQVIPVVAIIQQHHTSHLMLLICQYLYLQETRSNMFSFTTSANSFAHHLQRRQFLLF